MLDAAPISLRCTVNTVSPYILCTIPSAEPKPVPAKDLAPQLSPQACNSSQVSATYTACAQPSRLYIPFNMIYDSNSLRVSARLSLHNPSIYRFNLDL